MTRTIITAAVAIAATFTASSVFAQSDLAPIPANPAVSVYRHASTLEEGIQRGAADVIRAQGEYNLNTAIAARQFEEARSRAYDNQIKHVETYFAKREINRQARYVERGPRPTREDIERYSAMNASNGLSGREFEPALGELYWPSLFNHQLYAQEKEAIDMLFSNRTVANSGAGTQTHLAVKDLTDELEAKLKAHIHAYSPTEYMAAKRFLKNVAAEAANQVQFDGVVAR